MPLTFKEKLLLFAGFTVFAVSRVPELVLFLVPLFFIWFRREEIELIFGKRDGGERDGEREEKP